MMLDKIALVLTIIGGINWGLIGLFQFDLVAWIFGGQDAIVSRVKNMHAVLKIEGHQTRAEQPMPDLKRVA